MSATLLNEYGMVWYNCKVIILDMCLYFELADCSGLHIRCHDAVLDRTGVSVAAVNIHLARVHVEYLRY